MVIMLDCLSRDPSSILGSIAIIYPVSSMDRALDYESRFCGGSSPPSGTTNFLDEVRKCGSNNFYI